MTDYNNRPEVSPADLLRLPAGYRPQRTVSGELLDALINAAVEADRLGYAAVRYPADWLDRECEEDGFERQRIAEAFQ